MRSSGAWLALLLVSRLGAAGVSIDPAMRSSLVAKARTVLRLGEPAVVSDISCQLDVIVPGYTITIAGNEVRVGLATGQVASVHWHTRSESRYAVRVSDIVEYRGLVAAIRRGGGPLARRLRVALPYYEATTAYLQSDGRDADEWLAEALCRDLNEMMDRSRPPTPGPLPMGRLSAEERNQVAVLGLERLSKFRLRCLLEHEFGPLLRHAAVGRSPIPNDELRRTGASLLRRWQMEPSARLVARSDYPGIYFQEMVGGLAGFSHLLAGVDRWTGLPSWYSVEDMPVAIPTTPLVTRDEAIVKALQLLPYGTSVRAGADAVTARISLNYPRVSEEPVRYQQTLTWCIEVKLDGFSTECGMDLPPHYDQPLPLLRLLVFVDGFTGVLDARLVQMEGNSSSDEYIDQPVERLDRTPTPRPNGRHSRFRSLR